MFLIIYRLQKQKEEDDKAITEKQFEELRDQVNNSGEEIEKLKKYNASLEVIFLLIRSILIYFFEIKKNINYILRLSICNRL